jgi:hypothetical protein
MAVTQRTGARERFRGDLPTAVRTGAWLGLAVALTLMVTAMTVPALSGWDVHVKSFPPLHAEWSPRVGPGTPMALLLALLAVGWFPGWCRTAPWWRLLSGTFLFGAAWLFALATVDGLDGIGVILETEYEYLGPARDVTDVRETLAGYVDRIPYAHPDNWPPHVAGHPPGALLFFVALVRLGLGGGLASGLVVLLIAATVPAAVLVTLRTLDVERRARSVAPILVVGPAALWMAVSADAMFTAVAAWGLACLAGAARTGSRWSVASWGSAAGLLLGWCVMMSYGLPLLGLLALTILYLGRSFRPLLWAVPTAAAVVLAFGLVGDFWWWEAFPVLRERYWDGVASSRPASYWLWGNLAALAFSAGPLAGAAVGAAVAASVWVLRTRSRDSEPTRRSPRTTGLGSADLSVPLLLCLAGFATVALADLSLMSKAEVERIWLPFAPWLLVGAALLDDRWLRRGLALQASVAIVVQHLLFTGW